MSSLDAQHQRCITLRFHHAASIRHIRSIIKTYYFAGDCCRLLNMGTNLTVENVMSKNLRELGDKLLEYAELEDNELGEFCIALTNLGRRAEFLLSPDLTSRLEMEIELQLANFKNNATIIERELIEMLEQARIKHDRVIWEVKTMIDSDGYYSVPEALKTHPKFISLIKAMAETTERITELSGRLAQIQAKLDRTKIR